MNVITEIACAFFKGKQHHEVPPDIDRSHDLGIQAAELHTLMNLNMPKEVYQPRIDRAQSILVDMVDDDAFDLARFEVGYESIVNQKYDRVRDILKLKRVMPSVFEVGSRMEVAEPAAL